MTDSARNRILLALTDGEEIRKLSGYLSGTGYEVTVALDGADTLEKAVLEPPSIIISGLELPSVSGEKVFKILRRNKPTSKIPFIFLSDTIADLNGFRTGVDSFLSRPLDIHEVDARIRNALLQKDNILGGSKVIEGTLVHMSLADILQFLHMNKKEGELRVTNAAMHGVVHVKDGDVYNASLDGVDREKALYRILQWDDGKFEFMPKNVSVKKNIRPSFSNLLMEGMRQIDELKRVQERFPDKNCHIWMKPQAPKPTEDADPVVHDIIRLMKVYPRVEDLVNHCPHTDYEVYWALTDLIARGVIETHKPADGGKEPFLTVDQEIRIRERIISAFTDINAVNYAKVFLLSSSGALVDEFLGKCSAVPGFSLVHGTFFTGASFGNNIGEVATLKLHGGMDVALFSIPTVKNMGPVLKAFSTNLIGSILLWDGGDVEPLCAAKSEIKTIKNVPAVHIFSSGMDAARVGAGKQAFGTGNSSRFFRLDPDDKRVAFDVFIELFGAVMKVSQTPA